MTLEELYDRSLVVAEMRQARFTTLIGDRIWWVDPQNSVARLFTRDRKPASELMAIRILGTEGGGEWLWAWANALNFPSPASRAYAEEIKGAELGVDELAEPRLEVDELVNAQTFAIIALAMEGNAGYVLHRAGPMTAAFLVGEPFLTPDPTNLVAIGKAIGGVLGGGRPFANALDVIAGTFEALWLPHEVAGETVSARGRDGGTITIGVESGKFRCDIQSAPG